MADIDHECAPVVIKFLLLASLIFLDDRKAALFFHEKFEHGDHDEDAVALAGAGNCSRPCSSFSGDSKHQAIITITLMTVRPANYCRLAQMQADHAATPTSICLHLRVDRPSLCCM